MAEIKTIGIDPTKNIAIPRVKATRSPLPRLDKE